MTSHHLIIIEKINPVLWNRIIFMWLRLQAKILMRLRPLPYYTVWQFKIFKGIKVNIMSDILFSSDSVI
jgi:hypothetical protein